MARHPHSGRQQYAWRHLGELRDGQPFTPRVHSRLCPSGLQHTPHPGVIVQRVNMSPLFVEQLIDALVANLDNYAKTMPDGMIAEEDQ